MDWPNFLENPKAITNVYTTPPSLDGVHIDSLKFDWRGSIVTVTVLLRDFPEKPPLRWLQDKANAVTIDLQMLGAHKVSLKGWGNEAIATVTLERKSPDRIEIDISGDEFQFRCECASLTLEKMTPYLRDPDAEY